MKKKLCFLLMICLVLPMMAFFGCGSTNYYTFSCFPSDSGSGTCVIGGLSSNSGTFAEGSTVTITATPNEDQKFLGWVYRKTNLIVSEQGGYSIRETSKGGSVLSFASSQSREGQYTAVFSSIDQTTGKNLVEYVQFDSFRFEKSDAMDGALIGVSALEVSQGAATAEYVFAFEDDFVAQTNTTYKVSDYLTVNKVLPLTDIHNPEETPKKVKATLRIGSSYVVDNVAVKIFFGEGQEDEEVTYFDDVYEIKYTFQYNDEDYDLVLVYKILGENDNVEGSEENENLNENL